MNIGREGKRFRTEPVPDPFETEPPPAEPVEAPTEPAAPEPEKVPAAP